MSRESRRTAPRPPILGESIQWILIGALVLGLALWPTGMGQREIINVNGWPQLWRFIAAAVQPNLSIELWRITLDAAIVTLAYAIVGTFCSVILGAVFGLLASRVWWEALWGQRARWVYQPVRLLLAVPRSIHELLWGLLL